MQRTECAYVGLGSNLDKPREQVVTALSELDESPGLRLVASSSLYRSLPLGPADQPDYVNAVAALDATLDPYALLATLQRIERAHGRTRDGVRWGPRTLDLDILLYGAQRLNDDRLQVPHPGLPERAFVLYPLSEIAPALDIPGVGPLSALLQVVPATGIRRIDDVESMTDG